MSDLMDCETCGAFTVYRRSHKCPPVWLVRYHDYAADDATEIYAHEAEEAAEKFIDESETDGCMEPDDVIVSRDGYEDKRFSVTGEYSVTWSAREVTK